MFNYTPPVLNSQPQPSQKRKRRFITALSSLALFKIIDATFVGAGFEAVALHGGIFIVTEYRRALFKVEALRRFKGNIFFREGIYYKQPFALVIALVNIELAGIFVMLLIVAPFSNIVFLFEFYQRAVVIQDGIGIVFLGSCVYLGIILIHREPRHA